MAVSETGDSARVRFFRPMALVAYGQIGPLDADARYDVAAIDLASGDPAGARAQLDTLQRTAPTHLFGYMLQGELARRRGDAFARERAYRDFLSRYDRETAAGRVEYQKHDNALQAFRTEARKATSGPSR